MEKCECCYHSEFIDGTLYCNHKNEDVFFSDCCDYFKDASNLVAMHFTIKCYVHDEDAKELGEELALWLQESWFNGEDVLEVEFDDYEIVN